MPPTRLTLFATLLLLLAPSARAGDAEALDAALDALSRASAAPGSATPELCQPLEALLARHPENPVYLAHEGSCLSLVGRDGKKPEQQLALVMRGIGLVDRALNLLTPEDDVLLQRGVPVSLATRLAAVDLYLSLPDFVGKRPVGERVLAEALSNPAFARAPDAIRARLERHAAAVAAEATPVVAKPPELPPGVVATVAELTREDAATLRLPGGYTLINNQWNKRANPKRVTPYQDVFRAAGPRGPVFGWRWSWAPQNVMVVSFPEVVHGTKPWDVPEGQAFPADERFPFPAGSRKVTARFDVTQEITGTYDLAFEFWAVTDLAHPLRTISHEIMIWTDHAGPLQPAGEPAGSVVVDGVRFDAFLLATQTDMSGSAPNRWTFVTFVAEKPLRKGELTLSAFLDWCLAQKLLDRSAFITSVELGNEVVSGSGYTVLNDYAVTVQ